MDYNLGFARLQTCLRDRAPNELVALATLKDRFWRNQRRERDFGITSETKNEHAQIIYALNELALEYGTTSFDDLCGGAGRFPAQPTETLSISRSESGPGASSILPDQRVDFVLVTALPEERDAVLDRLPAHRQLPPIQGDIRTYFQADLPVAFPDNSTGNYRIIVMCLLGMGRVQAAVATSDAIRRWHPRYVFLLGISGGIAARNVRIGDILIADQIVDYELQKLTPQGPEIRWEVHRADPGLLDACNSYRGESWQKLIRLKRPLRGKPKLHTGPIASGDKVIAFGEIMTKYRDVWPKLIGVEMEAAGTATATFQSPEQPGFFMARGVSDLADENKSSSDVKGWRLYASAAVASFAVVFLRGGPIPLSEAPIQKLTETLSGETVPKYDYRAITKRVELRIEGGFDEFTSNRQQDLVAVLAALLRIDPASIQILRVSQGSIIVALEMPEVAANRLYQMATKRDFRLTSLGIIAVLVEGAETGETIELVENSTRTPPAFGSITVDAQDSAVAIGGNASASNLKIDLREANIETLIALGASKPDVRLQGALKKPSRQANAASHVERQTDPSPAPALLKVFLSYASEDRAMVRVVYDRLRSLNIDAWLDDENLLPGQDWQVEIRKAVRSAHVIIIFLSHRTVTKTGYVQKEIKYALDVADEQPEGAIFLIPAKLEDCEIPDRLGHLQWVNLRDGRGWSRLLTALARRAKEIGVSPPQA